MAQRGARRRLGLLSALAALGVLAIAAYRSRVRGDDRVATPDEAEQVVWRRPPPAPPAAAPGSDGSSASGVDGLLELTRRQLYELAQARDIPGRSRMSKRELAEALAARPES